MQAGFGGVVVYTCGNAAQALREELAETGLTVLEIGTGAKASYEAKGWHSPSDIQGNFPHFFDATSGHLPTWMMLKIAAAFRRHLRRLKAPAYIVPSGSGETILCLRWAFPSVQFIPAFSDSPATRYESQAPLLPLVFGTITPPKSPTAAGALVVEGALLHNPQVQALPMCKPESSKHGSAL